MQQLQKKDQGRFGPPEVLTYRYVGLTDDGDYFVSVEIPVTPPDQPDPYDPSSEDPDAPFAAFRTYSQAIAAFFDSFAPEDYAPDLAALDALIASLYVTGEG